MSSHVFVDLSSTTNRPDRFKEYHRLVESRRLYLSEEERQDIINWGGCSVEPKQKEEKINWKVEGF